MHNIAYIFLLLIFINCLNAAKHALSKHANVCELKRQAINAKLEAAAFQKRVQEVQGELDRSEKK